MRRSHIATMGIATVLTLASVAAASQSEQHLPRAATRSRDSSVLPRACTRAGQREIATAKLIVEFNATDGDLGVHGAFDDHGWKVLCVFDPTGDALLVVRPRSQLRDLAMAGIFFESREPPLRRFSFDDLVVRFPEGRYEVRGRAVGGALLAGTAWFTHDVPAPPVILAPHIVGGPRRAEDHPVPPRKLAVRWEQVIDTISGAPATITGYQVIVTKEEHDDPHGFARPVFDVHLPPGARRLRVPTAFVEPGTTYELEVLAIEESGNQTISVGFFAT